MIYTVISTKNRPLMLERCIASLQSESVKTMLFVVSDDAETREVAGKAYRDSAIQSIILDHTISWIDAVVDGICFFERNYDPRPDDLIYLCADDYEMREGWVDRTERFMASAGPALCSLELEPLFPWNTPLSHVEYNGVKGIGRMSLPGANWIMRYDMWPTVQAAMLQHRADITVDLDTCADLHGYGIPLLAIDEADHIGAYESSNGNQAFQVDARPLPKEWRL